MTFTDQFQFNAPTLVRYNKRHIPTLSSGTYDVLQENDSILEARCAEQFVGGYNTVERLYIGELELALPARIELLAGDAIG